MSSIYRDIDQPLRGSIRPKRQGNRLPLPSGRTALGSLVALAVVAASSAVAFRERPFRMPAEPPVEAAAAPLPEQAAAAPPVPAKTRTEGPSIIKVQPEQGTGGSAVVIRDPAAIGQDLRVAHLPDPDLVEQTEFGLLPVRTADGRRPFDVYARPWSGARGARVALVIGGLGLSQTGTQQAIRKLPAEVTLGFATQGNSLSRWMETARREGHEIVLQVPLEPFDYPNVDPGRNTLTVDAGAQENAERLHWALGRITNYVGVMNHMGARFTAEVAAISPVMEDLGRRGLLYLDDGSSARSRAPELAVQNRVPFAGADAAIDGVQERGAVLAKLDELERTARAKGFAIGTGSAFDVTVDAVAGWVAEARKRGIEIVPVSALAADPERG